MLWVLAALASLGKVAGGKSDGFLIISLLKRWYIVSYDFIAFDIMVITLRVIFILLQHVMTKYRSKIVQDYGETQL